MEKKNLNQESNAVVKGLLPAPAKKLIVVKRTKNNRWYVYFRGVMPDKNVGCSCRTAKSALKYMFIVKSRHCAIISKEAMNLLKAEAKKEA